MAKQGLLIVLSGPSGVGKDTILENLLSKRNDCSLSVSATTRRPRADEVNGKNYYFIDRDTFSAMISNGEILEHAEYSGNLYGTPSRPVELQRQAGKHVILEIEVQGALQVREKCPDAVFVFIMPPSMDALRCRLKQRGTESAEAMEERMAAAKSEIQLAEQYDYIIVNRDIEESCALLDAVITASGCGTAQMKQIIREVCDHA